MIDYKPVDTPMDPNIKDYTITGGTSTRSRVILTTCGETELSHHLSTKHFLFCECR